jgi:hypothetical protein
MSEGVEPEVKKYFLKILYSFTYGLLWLALNVVGGIYWGYGLIHGRLSVNNLLFFGWFLLSLAALLYYYYRTWRNYF